MKFFCFVFFFFFSLSESFLERGSLVVLSLPCKLS
jgi:hypothetical protein